MITASRFIVALSFLIFGIAKLFPIEPFEYLLVEQKLVGWDLAPSFARLIIFWEILLGLALLFNFKIKEVLKLTLLTLAAFTVYLSYDLLLNGNREDCGCTGQLITLDTIQSIFKNAILIALSLFLLKKGKTYNYKRPWLVLIIITTIAIASTLILAPFTGPYSTAEKVNEEINLDQLPNIQGLNQPIDYKGQELLIAFVSPKCAHCKLAIQRFRIIEEQNDLLPLYLVFYGTEEKVNAFVEEYSIDFPYIIFPDKEFMRITKGQMPTVFHINHGVLKNVWQGSKFDADELISL